MTVAVLLVELDSAYGARENNRTATVMERIELDSAYGERENNRTATVMERIELDSAYRERKNNRTATVMERIAYEPHTNELHLIIVSPFLTGRSDSVVKYACFRRADVPAYEPWEIVKLSLS